MSNSKKPKPDNRDDNVEKLQFNINKTIQNMEAGKEMIGKTPDENAKNALHDKNERRRQALDGFRNEIRDEAKAKERREQDDAPVS